MTRPRTAVEAGEALGSARKPLDEPPAGLERGFNEPARNRPVRSDMVPEVKAAGATQLVNMLGDSYRRGASGSDHMLSERGRSGDIEAVLVDDSLKTDAAS